MLFYGPRYTLLRTIRAEDGTLIPKGTAVDLAPSYVESRRLYGHDDIFATVNGREVCRMAMRAGAYVREIPETEVLY